MQDITHLLNRIGFGARPGQTERVQQMGIEKYVEEQLRPERIDDGNTERYLSALPSIRMGTPDLIAKYPQPLQLARKLGVQARVGVDQFDMRRRVQTLYQEGGLKPPQQLLSEIQAQKLIRAVHSDRQLQEVMTDFWFNHFNIFWLNFFFFKQKTAYEMHALGKFHDLLIATAKSPAMLVYLDNHLSSSIRGINENYARELMELHTLGVNGGYTQKDVQEVARALTGWSIEAPKRGGEFIFRPRMHDEGEKIVLGHKITGGGIHDGEVVMDILAKHPSTARFISTKLVRRFVADDPQETHVKHVTDIYRTIDDDIGQMVHAIVTSKEFDSPQAVGAKTKSPFEYTVSAIRSLDGATDGGRPLAQSIGRMGEPLYECQPPTGYPDRGDHWLSNGAVLERLNFAVALTAGRIPGTSVSFDEPAKSVVKRIGSPEFQMR
jgi:uncharacterized protein (DUF1800 family)